MNLIATSVLAFGLAASGCSKQQADGGAPAAQPASPAKAPDQAPTPAGQGESPDFVHMIMKPYEQCRGLLASDKAEGVAECATAMKSTAESAQAGASDAAKQHLAAIASAAKALAEANADDLDRLRALYGDVSRSVVSLLTAVPAAARDYKVFECPMAKGYKRWAQADTKMGNPYMGAKMLECGTEVHDHHQHAADGHGMDEDHGGMHDSDSDEMKHDGHGSH